MVHILGQEKRAKVKGELKDFALKFRITDRQMKPRHLDFTKTADRVNWTEEITVDKASSDTEAILGATFALNKTWPSSKYDIECLSVSEKMIQVPKMILP